MQKFKISFSYQGQLFVATASRIGIHAADQTVQFVVYDFYSADGKIDKVITFIANTEKTMHNFTDGPDSYPFIGQAYKGLVDYCQQHEISMF
jgi:hypothetical protein